MDISDDTPAELQPTFTLLNNHGGKLYQEGYFLKLDDQNAREWVVLKKEERA
jgi:CCR4-NOT transcriptional complex subunit CAF120